MSRDIVGGRGSNIYRVTSPAIHNNKDFTKTRPTDMSLIEKNLYPPYYLSPFACYTEATIIPAYIVRRPLHREMPSLGFNAINHSLQCRLLWPWQKSQGEAKAVYATERANQIKFTTMTFYWFEYGDT